MREILGSLPYASVIPTADVSDELAERGYAFLVQSIHTTLEWLGYNILSVNVNDNHIEVVVKEEFPFVESTVLKRINIRDIRISGMYGLIELISNIKLANPDNVEFEISSKVDESGKLGKTVYRIYFYTEEGYHHTANPRTASRGIKFVQERYPELLPKLLEDMESYNGRIL